MRTVKITTYKSFVDHNRPYYPTEVQGGLLVANFAHNCNDISRPHKRSLFVRHNVIFNRSGLVAIQCVWLSRYGYRVRWFYWQDNKRVTFRRLSWDNKVRVCFAWTNLNLDRFDIDLDFPPSQFCTTYAAAKGWL